MKRFLIFISFSIFFVRSTAQSVQSNQAYAFEQIGWKFTPPIGFKLLDSSSHTLNPTPEFKIWRKGYIFQNDKNTLSLSIIQSTQKGIDWENVHKKEEKQFYDQMRIRQPSTKYDSSSSTVTIDTEIFTKFIVTGRENGQIVLNHVQLSKYINGYRFNIFYHYTTKEMQDEIEKSINTGRFVH